MELIFGGAYQGKTQYAAQKYDLTDADIFTCEGLDLDPDARCIRHLERFARSGRTWREASGRLLSSLAAQADTGTRIFCGLPLEVKP